MSVHQVHIIFRKRNIQSINFWDNLALQTKSIQPCQSKKYLQNED